MSILMGREELAKTFLVILIWKIPLVSMVCIKIFQRGKG